MSWRVSISDLHGCSFSLVMTEEVVELEEESDVYDVGIFVFLVDRSIQVDVWRAIMARERV